MNSLSAKSLNRRANGAEHESSYRVRLPVNRVALFGHLFSYNSTSPLQPCQRNFEQGILQTRASDTVVLRQCSQFSLPAGHILSVQITEYYSDNKLRARTDGGANSPHVSLVSWEGVINGRSVGKSNSRKSEQYSNIFQVCLFKSALCNPGSNPGTAAKAMEQRESIRSA